MHDHSVFASSQLSAVSSRWSARRSLAIGVMATLVTTGLAACGSSDADSDAGSASANKESFDIVIADHDATGGPRARQIEDFIAAVNEQSDYVLDPVYHHDASLCPPNEQMICVQDGRADMTQVLSAYHPAELPMSTVGNLGFVEVPDATGIALMDLYEESEALQSEWQEQNLRPIFSAPVAEYLVGIKQPVESLDDLSGMSLRALGYSAEALSDLGVEPVPLPAPEIYEATQRGVLNGWTISLDYALTQGYDEVTSHVYDIGLGNSAISVWSVNTDFWESIPEELQETMLEVGEDFMVNAWVDYMVPAIEEECREAADELQYVGPLPDDTGVEEFVEEGRETAVQAWLKSVEGSVDDAEAWHEQYRAQVDSRIEELRDDYVPTVEACELAG